MSNKQNEAEAGLWEALPGGAARCRLCAHYCRLAEGEISRCGVRLNRQGKLLTRNAGELAAINLDPVEKKPLFHFLPGSQTYSLGSFGCNFSCRFCQNSGISQGAARKSGSGQRVAPEKLLDAAVKSGAASLSYTYNEPTVFFELLAACARTAKDKGLRNIMVSNAYLSKEGFSALDGLVDAANFDLKSFSDAFYRDYCGARLKPALQTLKRAIRAGWWVEVTTLIISGLNDSREELDQLADFLASELGPDLPWHVSAFRPAYLMPDHQPTPVASLERALEAGSRRGLRYVYTGNAAGHDAESTYCPACKKKLIARLGFLARPGFSGVCPDCGLKTPGIWI
ncbi:MAG: AmmeMemoRadiSam system radical SAM enzyme [Desulfovibrionaceae bacterium]|nr:AmmeMemoRadiSam system radical SAM enzyme [Desulfovibrionaceae bacterium]